jgi:hypothetical protein
MNPLDKKGYIIMVLRREDLDKPTGGEFRCPKCGTHYDPTYGPCPGCARKFTIAHIALATVVLVFLLLWLPLEAGAQVGATPTATPTVMIPPPLATLTPFVPTNTPVAPPTVAPPVTPTPTFAVLPLNRFIYLPIGAK